MTVIRPGTSRSRDTRGSTSLRFGACASSTVSSTAEATYRQPSRVTVAVAYRVVAVEQVEVGVGPQAMRRKSDSVSRASSPSLTRPRRLVVEAGGPPVPAVGVGHLDDYVRLRVERPWHYPCPEDDPFGCGIARGNRLGVELPADLARDRRGLSAGIGLRGDRTSQWTTIFGGLVGG